MISTTEELKKVLKDNEIRNKDIPKVKKYDSI